MLDMFNNKKKKQNTDDAQNVAGINFNDNHIEDVNGEGEASNVADTRTSKGAQKGFLIICCVGLCLLLAFGLFKNRIKNSENEQIQAANEASKKVETRKFELPPDTPVPAGVSEPAPFLSSEPAPYPSSAPASYPADDYEPASAPSPHEIRLRAALMVSDNDNTSKTQTVEGNSEMGSNPEPASLSTGDGEGQSSNSGNPLADSLNATVTPSTTANRFANRNLLLAKGTVIQCSLKTRIETQVAGMVACSTLRATYSDNKKVLLIERGSMVEGEYQHTAEMGQTRIFVLWTRIRTPKGIVVNLNSPATDTLGGAGIEGYTKHHFWRRFGNALMFSLIQDGISTGFSRLEKSKTAQTAVYENSEKAADNIVNEILKSTANIPPTIYKNQGDNAAVYVARDVDFSNVYSLTPRIMARPYSATELEIRQ